MPLLTQKTCIQPLKRVRTLSNQRLRPPNGLSGALTGVTLAAPCILLFWLARNTFYVGLSPRYAATGAGVYCVVVFTGLLALYALRLVSPFTAFLLMGLGALASGALLLSWLKPAMRLTASGP